MTEATIVHAITQLELGGAQEMTLIFCRHLAERGHDVHLVAGPGGMLDGEAREIPGVTVHFEPSLVREIRPARDLAAGRAIARRLRELRARSGRPMVVHTHSSKAGVVGRWAAWAAGAEVRVHSIHGFGFHSGQPLPLRAALQAVERATAEITTAFCPASEANLDVARRLGLLRRGQPTLVIPEGIDPDAYAPRPGEGDDVRRELGLDAATPLVGMIACLKPQKAPADFVRAAALIRERHPAAHFFVAGDGVLRPEVEAEVRALGLEDRFHLLGWRRDVRSLLGAADAFVLTSLWEGLPRAVLQSMAAGKPMVATRVDGTPEAIADGETGYLVEPRDVAATADRLSRLLDEPDRARALGAAARRRLERFRVGPMLERLEAFYLELLR